MYLAIDSNTKKQLVCKVINLDKLQARRGREQLRRTFQEVDILRQLQHVSYHTVTKTKSSLTSISRTFYHMLTL